MTDFTPLLIPDRGQPAHELLSLPAEEFDAWFKAQSGQARTLATAAKFKAKPGDMLILPGKKDGEWSAVFGAAKKSGPWALATLAERLPEGTYRLSEGAPGDTAAGGHIQAERGCPR